MKLDYIENDLRRVKPHVHRQGCMCLECLPAEKAQHHADCLCSQCYTPRHGEHRMVLMGPVPPHEKPVKCTVCGVYRFTAKKCPNGCNEADPVRLPDEKPYCFIRHSEGKECTCEPPTVVNKGMLEACTSAAHYMLSAMKMDAQPRSGLTRDDLDFLAVSTAKMAAHWGRRALGQQDLL